MDSRRFCLACEELLELILLCDLEGEAYALGLSGSNRALPLLDFRNDPQLTVEPSQRQVYRIRGHDICHKIHFVRSERP